MLDTPAKVSDTHAPVLDTHTPVLDTYSPVLDTYTPVLDTPTNFYTYTSVCMVPMLASRLAAATEVAAPWTPARERILVELMTSDRQSSRPERA